MQVRRPIQARRTRCTRLVGRRTFKLSPSSHVTRRRRKTGPSEVHQLRGSRNLSSASTMVNGLEMGIVGELHSLYSHIERLRRVMGASCLLPVCMVSPHSVEMLSSCKKGLACLYTRCGFREKYRFPYSVGRNLCAREESRAYGARYFLRCVVRCGRNANRIFKG